MSKPNMQNSDGKAIRKLHPTSETLSAAALEAERLADQEHQRLTAGLEAAAGGIQVRGWNSDSVRRLKHAVEAHGGPTSVAQKAGVSISTLNAAISGRNEPKIGFLSHVAVVMGISLDWILWGEGNHRLEPRGRSSPADSADLLRLPFYDVRASAGPGATPLAEEPTEVIEIERRFAQMLGITASDIIALPVHGDSAQPGLAEGDMILVDRNLLELRDGGLYVIGVDSDVVVKRVHRQVDRSVVLRSDNPAYEPQHVTADDVERLRVIGRVRWAIRGM